MAAAASLGFALVLGAGGPIGQTIARFAPSLAAPPAASASEAAVYLVRSTLMALDDANRTGNYSVFRMLASPSFQAANSPDGLAEAFSVHRARALDLSVAALSPPEWSALPAIGQDGRLRLSGAYLLGGDLLRFALAYEASGGSWRLYEIRVGTEPQRATGRQASVR